MAGPSLHTVQLHQWLERMRAGDLKARDEMLRKVVGRLDRLARKMIRDFPTVQRWAQTDDVLQNALLRLLRSLQEVQPASVRDFFGLAAEQMRRELLDLARHFGGPMGQGAHHHSQGRRATEPAAPPIEPTADNEDDVERWTAFHEHVAQLPAEEREIVGLVFYHGWTQAQVAELFNVSERTIRRRWESALVQLHRKLRDSPSPPDP